MPIYEYKAVSDVDCRLCQCRFEVRQGFDDEPLKTCPECGAAVRRLFSASFVLRTDPLSDEEVFGGYAGEEADELGPQDDFGEDEVWD